MRTDYSYYKEEFETILTFWDHTESKKEEALSLINRIVFYEQTKEDLYSLFITACDFRDKIEIDLERLNKKINSPDNLSSHSLTFMIQLTVDYKLWLHDLKHTIEILKGLF